VVLISGTAAVQAQNGGWHFGSWSKGPISAFTPQPNDACQRNEMKSPGMLSYLNAKVGQNYGPSAHVVGVESLQGAFGQTGSYLSCHGVLALENGAREAGTLSVQDPGGGAALNVNWESDAAKDRRLETPERQALRKYCATATPQGCALYTRKIAGCRPLSGNAYSILSTQRLWQSKGSSPAEAAELSIDAISRGNPSGSPRDLAIIVKRAEAAPGTVPLQQFSDTILKGCIASASR
jgi:hypothetical protein